MRQGLLLIAVASVVFLTGLGGTRLWDDDETYFAQVSREMFDRGDLVVPWFNQALFSHKPPFMYWMMMAAYQVLGVTEFAARLPSAIFGTATVLLVWRLGRILYSPGAGFWAGIVLSTSLNFVVISRAATCDAELAFFCTLSLYFFACGTTANDKSDARGRAGLQTWGDNRDLQPAWRTYMLVYASMGMAMLVKGPIGVVLPAGVLGVFQLWKRSPGRLSERVVATGFVSWTIALFQRTLALLSPSHVVRTIWSMRPLTALATILLVAGPWFAAVAFKTNGEFLSSFFGIHHFHRFTATMDNHGGPPGYYLLAICVGFFPWIIFFGPSASAVWRRIGERHAWLPADVLVCAWTVVWIMFFSLATTKFPHYVVPAYPALALLTGRFVDRWSRDADVYGRLARNAAWLTLAAAGIGIMIVVPLVAKIYLSGDEFLGMVGLPLIAGAGACAWFSERRQIGRVLASLAATAVCFSVGLFAIAAVQVDRHQNTAPFAESIRRHSAPGAVHIGTFRYFRPGLVYYCNDRVEQLADSQAAGEFLKDPLGQSFLVTTEAEYEQIAAGLPVR
ncbi:MAG TPA: glycosyltransferase family 39 protein, partial [Planctomycetaceae bacterium]|nr:glycosyltransferase family 39 protein [Planctomycetaceae bacterium]